MRSSSKGGGRRQLKRIARGASTVDSFDYDTRGNVTSRNGVSLLFDQKNQLTQIPGHDSYAYDANGRRVQKTPASGGASTYYFYNHAGQLLYQSEPGRAKATNFIYLGTRMITRHSVLQIAAPASVSFDDPHPDDGDYTVTWDAVIGATSYILQERANGGAWVTVYAGSTPSRAFTGRAGGSYVYRAQACASEGCGDWAGSATLGVRPTIATMSGPTGLVFGSYTVSWTAPISASAYTVQERFNAGAWTTVADSVPATSIVLARPVGGTYDYRVSASNAYGSRGWSLPITVAVTQVPDTPTNFVFGTDSNGQAVLTWDAMPFTTTYQLTVYGTHGSLGTYIYTVGDPSFVVPPANYQISKLAACSLAGCSAPAQVSGGLGGGLGDTAKGSGVLAKAMRLLGATPATSSGCTATNCRAVVGGTP